MGQSSDLLISPATLSSRDQPAASVSPVSPLPRTCAPQPAGPRPKPTPRQTPKPRQRLSLLEAIQSEEEEGEGGGEKEEKSEGRLASAVKEGQDHLVLRLLQAGVPLDGLDSEGVSLDSIAIFLFGNMIVIEIQRITKV